MPYLMSTLKDAAARETALCKVPCGAGMEESQITGITKLEIWSSSFSDPGGDWTRFDAFNSAGDKIASKTVPGY